MSKKLKIGNRVGALFASTNTVENGIVTNIHNGSQYEIYCFKLRTSETVFEHLVVV